MDFFVENLRARYSRAAHALREGLKTTPRSWLLNQILFFTLISAVLGFILSHYLSVDVLSSLLFLPFDCFNSTHPGEDVGGHCFSDYLLAKTFAMQSNPWIPLGPPTRFGNNYPPASMLPHFIFGHLGQLFGQPRLGLTAYLVALTAAVLSPAIWAASSARGLTRRMLFVSIGAVATPVWMTVDRGNSTGFVVPIMLVYLIALSRKKWKLVTIMVVLAALVKPQFALMGVALLAARQWRLSALAATSGVFASFLAYLLWPHNFPATIVQSMRGILGYWDSATPSIYSNPMNRYNASFVKGIFLIPDALKAQGNNGVAPQDYLGEARTLIGFAIPAIIVIGLLVLGKRIPPLMVGLVLLPTAALFPIETVRYYLVFALPIAALIIRDPNGDGDAGIFDKCLDGGRKIGKLLSVATAATIAQIPLPFPPAVRAISNSSGVMEFQGTGPGYVETTTVLTPLLWLAACITMLTFYARSRAKME